MSKKVITDDVVSELASGSVFFRPAQPQQPEQQEEVPGSHHLTELPSGPASTPDSSLASTRASRADSTPASNGDSTLDSTVDSTLASKTDSANASTRASRPAIKQASAIARKQASSKAITQSDLLARTLASSGDLVDAIYRVVKRPGKEVYYVRLTEREKSELNTIVSELGQEHSYKVTETEIIRIAICNLLADYAEQGTESLLMRVIVDLKD